jgi:hypothetical protein
MPLAGSAVLAIWNGIAPQAEDEFVAWHVREHIPERVGLPGFLKGRRYVAVDGEPKYFNFYETERVEDLSSPAYLARLDAPTPWTKAVVAHFKDTSRTICRVAVSRGIGDGAAIMTVRLGTSQPRDVFYTAVAEAVVPAVLSAPGIVAVHVLEGDTAASQQQTAEKRLRDRADAIDDWILLVEAVGPEAVFACRKGPAGREALAAAGADPALRYGIYSLQYALSSAQLAVA